MSAIASTDLAEASARVIQAIETKRSGLSFDDGEIEETVGDFLAGRIPDYQMAAWLATVACCGLNAAETAALTRAYVSGGRCVDLGGIGRPVIDKHSTGGVGDKTSLVVVPLVAACGVAVAKMSGRGLGYAGGTIDKLEAIEGLQLDLSAAKTRELLEQVGMVMTGQSPDLAPGDEATYRLRDVTGTVSSIPLIAASIISKKVTIGADGLVLDVKIGIGSLTPQVEVAEALAQTMIDLAGSFGLRARAVLTDMSQPLGFAIGNALEVKEALAALQGERIPGLSELSAVLARLMLQLAEPDLTNSDAEERIARALRSGAAHDHLLRWAQAQGANIRRLENPATLPSAARRAIVTADRSGWIEGVDPRAIGMAALRLGAGRLRQDDALDHAAGLVTRRRVGDPVKRGDVLAELHYTRGDVATAVDLVRSAFTIGSAAAEAPPVIHRILGHEATRPPSPSK